MRTILTQAVVLLAFLSCVAGTSLAELPGQPNFLFILTDDHALEAIGAYDKWLKPYVQTPTIDKLADEGMRFTNVCCNNSICSPSRASIITGQFSHINGGRNLNCSLAEDAPSYSRQLKEAGYQTAVVGKWHMMHTPRGMNFYAVTKGQGKYFDPTFTFSDGTKKSFKGYYADIYTDQALNWLKQRTPGKPFCLNLHFKGPHHPYDYPERHEKLLAGTDVPEPSNLHEDVESTSPLLKKPSWSHLYQDFAERSYYPRHEQEYEKLSDDAKEKRSISYQHMIHKYIRCVAAIDENIKRVLDYLDAEGIKDNTVIIYTSDQGYWLGQHGLYDKRLILEESLKMPFIVRFPSEIKPGTVNHDLCSNVDFAETILDFAKVKPDARMQGRSLRPLLQGETPNDWRDAIFYAYYARAPYHWGIRTDRYKLVRFPNTNDAELYDLKNDPQEMKNVATDPSYAKILKQMDQKLVAKMKEVKITRDQLPGYYVAPPKQKKVK